jgi:hypothetical protein
MITYWRNMFEDILDYVSISPDQWPELHPDTAEYLTDYYAPDGDD